MAKTKKSKTPEQPPGTQKKPYRPPFYQSFRLEKTIKDESHIPNSFKLFKEALIVVRRHITLFATITAIIGAAYLVFVQGLTSVTGFVDAKHGIEQSIGGVWGSIVASATLYGQMLGSPASAGSATNLYQFMVTIVASLALIWVFRQLYAGHKVRARDGFYQGMYPLIPFLLVLAFIALELLPFAIGGTVFTIVVRNGIAASDIEVLLWGSGFFVLALISLYLVVSSLWALYIVTLPNTTPMQALRSARELAVNRRWLLMRKMLFLPLILTILVGLVMIPLIMFATLVVGWLFFVLVVICLVIAHSYMYRLYRSLL